MKIQATKRLKKIGGSHYILLNYQDMRILNVKNGSIINVTLESDTSINIECPKCKTRQEADSTQEVFDCSLCDKEFTKGEILEQSNIQ